MTNQHFQQQQDHRYSQDEEQEVQLDQDRQNHTLCRSPIFNNLFAEVMNERLLDMYDWETLPPENREKRGQLFELESTVALEQPVLVQDDAEQAPRTHAIESSEEGEQQKKKQIAEECDQTPLENIQNNSTLHSFDSILFQIEQMQKLQKTDPSSGTSPQHDPTTKPSSYSKKNIDTWVIDSRQNTERHESSSRTTLHYFLYWINSLLCIP